MATLAYGYTTGACAAAAARGAARMLRTQEQLDEISITLPRGETASFRLHGQTFDDSSASCFVVKDAGSDPDVTHGAEIHVTVQRKALTKPATTMVFVTGGPGIGRVTKPGLAVPVGEWAINPVPRRMITEAVVEVFPSLAARFAPHVTISIPDGEQRAQRTLNVRLGIVGGLSILGTTGVVTPISHQAWTDTIDAALGVALAAGCTRVVASTGRSSEQVAEQALALPEEAFILMGDHVGHLAAACAGRGVQELVIAAQFAKLLKIACGHPQTHAAVADLDLAALTGWARTAGLDAALSKRLEWAHTARELYLELGPHHPLVALVAARAIERLESWAPGIRCGVLLAGYAGEPAVTFGALFGAREP